HHAVHRPDPSRPSSEPGDAGKYRNSNSNEHADGDPDYYPVPDHYPDGDADPHPDRHANRNPNAHRDANGHADVNPDRDAHQNAKDRKSTRLNSSHEWIS